MKQPDIGYVRVQVGDLTLLSQAYRCLQWSIDNQRRSVSDAGMQRLRTIIAQVEDLSDYAEKGGTPITGVWSGVPGVAR